MEEKFMEFLKVMTTYPEKLNEEAVLRALRLGDQDLLREALMPMWSNTEEGAEIVNQIIRFKIQ